jgi:hypothetical protein
LSYVIDLRAKQINSEKKIWRVFPGERYRFWDTFKETSLVFLDLPDLTLPDELISSASSQIRERIVYSHAMRKWRVDLSRHTRSGRKDPPPERPSHNLDDYTNADHKKYTSELGGLRALFGEAHKGDLIIVPSSIPKRRVLIGELLDDALTRVQQELERYDGAQVIGRRVRWINPVDELRVSPQLSDILRRPNPVTRVSNEFYYNIFDEYYGSYYLDFLYASRFDTGSYDFTTQNSFDFGVLNELFSKLTYDVDVSSKTEEYRDISIVFSGGIPSDYRPRISCNVNSPGIFNFKAPKIVPLIAAALFSLMVVADSTSKPRSDEVSVINSGSEPGSAGDCTPEINEKLRATLDLMGYSVWQEACKRAQSLHSEPLMRSRSTVQGGPARARK